MDRSERTPVRVVLGLLGLADLATGAWAVIAPRSWYLEFPGFGHHWVAAQGGGFNEHLASDAGSGFLAVAAALLLAAVWMQRRVIQTALVVTLVHSVPHLLHHLTHSPERPLTTVDKVASVGGIALQVAVAVALLAVVARRTDQAGYDDQPVVGRGSGVV